VKLLDSLLDAIVRLEGDALVMHVGEKPYVVTASSAMSAYRGPLAWGQVELSSRVLTFEAVSSMLSQILPADQQHALEELGAIEHEIPPGQGHAERFTVVAARGGEDVWVEVRRRPVEVAQAAAVEPQPAVEESVALEEPVTVAEPVALAQPEEPAAQAEAVAQPEAIEEIAAPPIEDLPLAEVAGVDALVEEAPPDPLESIVVALPGHETEEVSLSGVPDDAIELIDEEPQDLPTEAEVDAMLAATAAALLTSGLGAEPVIGDFDLPLDPRVVETPEPVLVGALASASVQEIEPAFELSPPTWSDVAEEESEVDPADLVPGGPLGTPLFTDEAFLAAAAPEIQEALVSEPPAEEPPAPEPLAHERVVHEPPVLEPPVAVSKPEPAIAADAAAFVAHEAEPPAAIEPEADLAPDDVNEPDLAAQLAVWQAALKEWAEPSTLPTIPEPALSSEPDVRVPPNPEILMEPTSHDSPAADADEGRQAVVVPLSRASAKLEPSVPYTPAPDARLMQTLRAAAARGAATVYVVAQSKPMIRVDGEISALESEPALTAADVERLVMELVPPRRRDALQNGPVEWLCDMPEIGRVRCLTFKDHRGPGVLFRMFPARAISADHLSLTPEVQALCQQAEGLVLVTGARASGKSTLLNAFVDLINRTRSDHLITIESQIGFVHESRKSFISQRETRGDTELAATYARAALREDPDVMMIEDLKSPDFIWSALEAAESGRLVLASISAASTVGAIDRVIEAFPADRRSKVRATLAGSLRGVIAQVLLRRVTGGRAVAREILLNTPAVSTTILEGKTFQLPTALESGRRLGMVPLTDSLAAHVREGAVQVEEAYRKALDRESLLTALKRDGFDTSFAERLA
jgi:twitching motility protein PilT